MIRVLRAAVLLLLMGSMGAWAQDPAPKKALKFPLSKINVKKGSLRPGIGIQGEIPESAYQAKVAGEPILFFDMNGDDMLAPETDTMSMVHGPFVVTVPETLLLKIGQFKVSFEGTKQLLLTPEDLGTAQPMVADAALMTEIRVRSGVRPAMLDAKSSADCLKHIEYLKKNNLIEGEAGLLLHQEDPAKPGYTPEGAEAGKHGDIFPKVPTMRVAIQGWYQTVWHAVPMVDPGLKAFGAAVKYNMAVLHFSQRDYYSGGTLPYPPDGAIGIPRSFCELGENPNPVPGTDHGKGTGIPIFVRSGASVDTVVMTDPSGRPVPGTTSSPAKPASSEWPTNSGVSCFIPSKPLAPMTTYKVSFKFAGVAEPLTWSFTTGAR